MRWVLIGGDHVNMDNVELFRWDDGKLKVFFNGEYMASIEDPDKECYIKLCRQMGVRPYEETNDG